MNIKQALHVGYIQAEARMAVIEAAYGKNIAAVTYPEGA